jgi:hypothetical protein
MLKQQFGTAELYTISGNVSTAITDESGRCALLRSRLSFSTCARAGGKHKNKEREV